MDKNNRIHEEEIVFKEIDCTSIPQEEDKDTKTTTLWQKNNTEIITSNETNNRTVNSRTFADIECQRDRNEEDVGNETWKEQCADDILEDERKNSKNVINAKLNNQEHNLEVERQNEKDQKIHKIDLRAYGFENEFSDQKSAHKPQRMVNRLDLRFFGYQDGVRCTQSNNHLDQLPHDKKSNLTKYTIDRERHFQYKEYSIDTSKPLAYKDLAKSSRDLNELHDEFEKIGPLMSAKSMPNIADDLYYYANPIHANSNDENKPTVKNLPDYVSDKKEAAMDERHAMKMDNEISCDVDRSFEDVYIKNKVQSRETDEKLSMPSVKKLAETFSKRHTTIIGSVSSKVHKITTTKIDDLRDMSSTPEIQIIETPRQIHSLTARSLSREFREGLRSQMPSKVTSPPVNRSLMEERPTNRSEIVRSKREGHDITVISPGKLKSNIMFWEQIQKKD